MVVTIALLSGVAAAASSGGGPAPAQHSATPTTGASGQPRRDADTLLLAHRTDAGTLDLAVIIASDPAARGDAAVLLLPPPTMVQVPALQTQTLASLPAFVDDDVLALTVMNATGLRIDATIVADDLLLAQLLAPGDPITVEFGRGVRIEDDNGTFGYPEGRHELASADAYRTLLGGEAGGTLAHLLTVRSVLEGWFARLDRAAVADETIVIDERAAILREVGGADVTFLTLPVERVDVGDDERFRLLDGEARDLIEQHFPRARIARGERPRAELRNGTGTVGITQRASKFLVPAGIQVALTDNVPGFGQDTTTIIYYRDEDRGAARRVAGALGVGTIVQSAREIDVVDLSVVLGRDFEREHPDLFRPPTETTAPSVSG